mmetsp:Transcript_16202/g.40970  ORF Transcript_16202/g.40970 Transcript_16202/m.40970 type:complete len:253 (-) Transcript_16202:166-924(-)
MLASMSDPKTSLVALMLRLISSALVPSIDSVTAAAGELSGRARSSSTALLLERAAQSWINASSAEASTLLPRSTARTRESSRIRRSSKAWQASSCVGRSPSEVATVGRVWMGIPTLGLPSGLAIIATSHTPISTLVGRPKCFANAPRTLARRGYFSLTRVIRPAPMACGPGRDPPPPDGEAGRTASPGREVELPAEAAPPDGEAGRATPPGREEVSAAEAGSSSLPAWASSSPSEESETPSGTSEYLFVVGS